MFHNFDVFGRRDLWSRFFRSAGAYPPRWLKNRFLIVARGPVPRDLHRHDVCFPSVVCDRLKVWHVCQPFTNRSGSGDPELQG